MATTIAVAVSVGGTGRGSGSKRALRWAIDNLLPQASRFVLVHVMPNITHIPTPSGDRVAIKDIDAYGATNYMKDVRERAHQIFLDYTTLHRLPGLEFETLLLEDDDVSSALVGYISNSTDVKSLVIGSSSSLPFWRKTKAKRVAETVLKSAGSTTDVYVVHKRKVKKRLASSMPSNDMLSDKHTILSETHSPTTASSLSQTPVYSSFSTDHTSPSQTPVYSSFSTDNTSSAITPVSSWSELTRSVSFSGVEKDDPDAGKVVSDNNVPSTKAQTTVIGKFVLDNEVDQLRAELDTTKAMYNLARDNLFHAQEEVKILSSECVEEVKKVDEATEREETMRKIAVHEKMKHMEAVKEVKKAKHLLAKEYNQRQKAERVAQKESEGRQRVVEELISKDSRRRSRQYTIDEIREATDCFSESKVIGEGSYGKVYKGLLDHTPVAIKVLQSDAIDKKEEFLKEVKILSELHHPNIVLLLGICPEIGCLVYEYIENGSLEQHIFRHHGREPLPWFARFKIAFEIACGLAFLHSNKPNPIVHRDLNPGNILLGRHYVTKISDVGLAALLSETAPDSVTMFGTSLLAGTLYYMDPEYQRTGTIRPKSDLYSFGIILLQLLTGRHPNGLLLVMENGIASKSLGKMLDNSVKNWPVDESEELINIAMECCKLRCRDRPDLEKVVLPALKRLADFADDSMKGEKCSKFAPSHYFCPILYEIMEDPHIAADGFTYERKAIEAWLKKSDESPVTKNKLEHLDLTPNMTLLAGIKDWKSHKLSN